MRAAAILAAALFVLPRTAAASTSTSARALWVSDLASGDDDALRAACARALAIEIAAPDRAAIELAETASVAVAPMALAVDSEIAAARRAFVELKLSRA